MFGEVVATNLEGWRRKQLRKRVVDGAMADYLAATPPMWNMPVNDCRYLVIDIETTGLSVQNDTMLSLGLVPIEDGQIRIAEAQHFLLSSDKPVGQSATIHGIHDSELDNGESLEAVMPRVLNALQGRVLVVHFSRLDVGFLNKSCRQLYGVDLMAPTIDTMQVERRYHQKYKQDHELPSLNLDDCRARYGLPRYRAHNACTDALATAELWLAQISHLQKLGKTTLYSFR